MEAIYAKLGNPGKFQVCIFLLLALNIFPAAFNHVCMAFTAYSPAHYCKPSNKSRDGTIQQFQTENTTNTSVQYWQCKAYYGLGQSDSGFRKCSAGDWVYQLEDGESTIVSEWDLVCDSAAWPNIANAVFFVGLMFGGLLFGYLSDRFGRRPVMLVTLYLPIAVGVGVAFVQHLETFMALRFLQGMLVQGLQTVSYVMVVEWFGVHQRTTAGCLLTCFWGMGVFALGGIAYIMKDWRFIQLAISLPSLLAIGYIWIIPESLRWLHTRGRVTETNILIKKVCKFNKIDNPIHSVCVKQRQSHGKLLDVVKTPSMRKRSFPLFFVWLSCNVGYYGLTLKSTSLAGNRYLNFFIASALEFIAYAIAVIVAKTFGIRRPLAFYFFLAAFCCIICGVIPTKHKPDLQMVATGFAIGGKFAVGGMFSLIELFTTELYPTTIRNMGMGSCAFCGRVGAALAPQIIILGVYTSDQVPVIIYGVLTLLGGVFTLCLPETKDANLPDTVHEVEMLMSIGEVRNLISRIDREIEVTAPINENTESSTV